MVEADSPPSNANEGCVGPTSESAGTNKACEGCPNQKSCASGAFNSPEAQQKELKEQEALKSAFENVSHVVLVLSGKGGVGKSTLSAQICHALSTRGFAVGLLDVDLCGPSVPRMMGVAHQGAVVHRSGSGAWTPVYASPNLAVMSISFLLPDSDAAVVWRGPRKNALIQQFLTDTDWEGDTGGLDYLVIDTPPGTSDEHISTVQFLQKAGAVSGAVVVTTPEEVSMADVRKELNFCEKTKVPVLGIVENMATYQKKMSDLTYLRQDGSDVTKEVLVKMKETCPELLDLLACSEVFPTSGSGPEGMAKHYNISHWGRIPLDSKLCECCETGKSFVDEYPTSLAAKSLNKIIDNLVNALPVETVEHEDSMQET